MSTKSHDSFCPGDIVHLKIGYPCPSSWYEAFGDFPIEIVERVYSYEYTECYECILPDDVAAIAKKRFSWHINVGSRVYIDSSYLEPYACDTTSINLDVFDSMF